MKIGIALVLLAACGTSAKPAVDEEVPPRLAHKLATIEQALAGGHSVELECMSADFILENGAPKQFADKLTTLCFVEAPKRSLRVAIANAKEMKEAYARPYMQAMAHHEPGDECVYGAGEEALRKVAAHPSHDRELDSLVAEFTALCPKQAALAHQPEQQAASKTPEEIVLEAHIGNGESMAAAGNALGVFSECGLMQVDAPSLPANLVARAHQLCGVTGPELVLTAAVADAEKYRAKLRERADLYCQMEPIGPAFAQIARHASDDRKLKSLVEHYAKLCPKYAAQARRSGAS